MKTLPPLLLDHARRGGPGAGRALLLLALSGNVLGGLYCADLGMQAQALEDFAHSSSAQRAPDRASRRAADDLRAELGRANDVLRALGMPWERLFGALESVSGPDVSLLALDPAPDKHNLRLSGEARNMRALLDYLRKLGASGAFAAVHLQSHQVQQADPQRPVRFVMVLEWAS